MVGFLFGDPPAVGLIALWSCRSYDPAAIWSRTERLERLADAIDPAAIWSRTERLERLADAIDPAAIWSRTERELITSWLISSPTSRAR
jgi:hypothetical protein